MMRFAGYTIEVNGALTPHLLPTREAAVALAAQNGMDASCVVQLFRNVTEKTTEIKDEASQSPGASL